MPTFSQRSKRARAELHRKLQELVDEAIKEVDFVILDAQRGRAEQEKAFKGGFSKAHFGQSAHNYEPAVALDIVPYPIDFNNVAGFRAIAKTFMATAKRLNIPLRWGGDWDMDGDWKDERFLDWGHFELHKWQDFAKRDCVLIED
jgi:peptidoglycan L-alanyl-D-glutamate endopeptidase CwlK